MNEREGFEKSRASEVEPTQARREVHCPDVAVNSEQAELWAERWSPPVEHAELSPSLVRLLHKHNVSSGAPHELWSETCVVDVCQTAGTESEHGGRAERLENTHRDEDAYRRRSPRNRRRNEVYH